MRRLTLVLALLVLTACGGGGGGSADLSQETVQPLLVQTGDLPEGFSSMQVRNKPPSKYEKFGEPSFALDQRFQKGGKPSGGVAVVTYDDQTAFDNARNTLMEADKADAANQGFQEVPGIGDKAWSFVKKNPINASANSAALIFSRCKMLVDILIVGTEDIKAVTEYATKLDQRLNPLACPAA